MNRTHELQVNRNTMHWGFAIVLAMALTAPALVRAQVSKPVDPVAGTGTNTAVPTSDRSVVGVLLKDRGLTCATKPQDSLMRHAQEGYAAAAEFSTMTRQGGHFAVNLESPPEQLLDEARKKGCAMIVADSDQAGVIVASLIASRSPHRVLSSKPVQVALSALLGVLGIERYDQLLLLEALPAGGSKDDLQDLIGAGVRNPEQLALLNARIAQSGYATSVDIESLRQFLVDEKEGARTGKTAYLVKQARQAKEAAAEKARQATEAAAEKERVDAEEKKIRDADRAEMWGKVKTWATGIATVIVVGLIAWVVAGTSSQCPSCKKWFALQRLQTNELGRSTGYETETKVDTYKNNKGEVIATKERQEDVRVTYVKYQHLNQCKFCSYQWWSQSSSKYKG